MIVADAFSDGNMPAGSGSRRVVERAIAALSAVIGRIRLRGDSALREDDLMTRLDASGVDYALSAAMSRQFWACIVALAEDHWRLERDKIAPIRDWAKVDYLPDNGRCRKYATGPRRYPAIRIRPIQCLLLGDGGTVRHFAIITNCADPLGGSGLDLIRWLRGKAGTFEHAHDVLMNELAGAALPRQEFGANTAWLSLNVLLYTLLSAFKRVGLPEELHTVRPKRLRLLLLSTVGKVARRTRTPLDRLTTALAKPLADPPRTAFNLSHPLLTGV